MFGPVFFIFWKSGFMITRLMIFILINQIN